MDAGNWITLILGLGTLGLGLANAYAQWPRGTVTGSPTKINRAVVLMAALTAIVVGAVGYDVYDRNHQVQRDSVVSWGAAGTAFHMAVTTHDLQNAAKTQRMMLILRPVLMGSDPMTDTNIAKSGLFTISGPTVVLAISSLPPLLMAADQMNFMEFNAVLLPVGVGPERIRSLADVLDLGGRIYQTRATSVMAGAPLDQVPQVPPLNK